MTKTTNQSTRLNGDTSGAALAGAAAAAAAGQNAGETSNASTTSSPAVQGYERAVETATKEHHAAVQRAKNAPTRTPPAIEPAFNEPASDPALPRDEFHGMGGEYHVIDGKRVRVEPKKA